MWDWQVPLPTEEHCDARLLVRKAALRLTRWMIRAIKNEDMFMLEHLLELGVPPMPSVVVGIPARSVMLFTLMYSLDAAKLLRKYNVKLVAQNEDEAPGGQPSNELLIAMANDASKWVPGAVQWVQSAPRAGRMPVATLYHAAAIDTSKWHIHTSWPPRGVKIGWTSTGVVVHLSEEQRCAIRRFWNDVADLRRQEAKHLAGSYWHRVRWAVAVRPYAKAWLEDYAERNGGPGSRFHLEGVAGFEEEFLS